MYISDAFFVLLNVPISTNHVPKHKLSLFDIDFHALAINLLVELFIVLNIKKKYD